MSVRYGSVLRQFITKHVVTLRLVNHGTADKPNWGRESLPFVPTDTFCSTRRAAKRAACSPEFPAPATPGRGVPEWTCKFCRSFQFQFLKLSAEIFAHRRSGWRALG